MRSFGSRDQLNHFLRAAKPVRNQARITAQSFHGELSRHAPFRIRGVFRHESNFIEANSRTPAKICFQAFGKTGRLDRRLHKRANEGKKIFASAGCSGCHTLADANATGTVGPNLDDAKPDYRLATARVTNGKGVMPTFKGQLTDQQIADVASYVVTATGGTP